MLRFTTVLITAGMLVALAGCQDPARSDRTVKGVADAARTESPLSHGDVYQFSAESITGETVELSEYRGKVLLIVNVASRCGNTPQYADLQALYERKQDDGLVVLGFPANDFANQEPGSNEDIQAFCRKEYQVTFPMFAKIHVKGPGKHPLYVWLTDKHVHPDHGGKIGWNFTKFLIGRDGKVVARFSPRTSPSAPKVIEAVEKALARG